MMTPRAYMYVRAFCVRACLSDGAFLLGRLHLEDGWEQRRLKTSAVSAEQVAVNAFENVRAKPIDA